MKFITATKHINFPYLALSEHLYKMLQPHKNTGSTLSSDYRYSFNGMEKDDEVYGAGNSYDFGARIYNPRLGRWMSADPYSRKYPFSSPYSYAFNKPMYLRDFDGKDVIVVITSQAKTPTVDQPLGDLGHVTLAVSNYTSVTLWVVNAQGERMQKTFFVKTGTMTLIQNNPGTNQSNPALDVSQVSEDYPNSKIAFYVLNEDVGTPTIAGNMGGGDQEWMIDPNQPDYDPSKEYFTEEQVEEEITIIRRTAEIAGTEEPYKHYFLDEDGNLDQNDCGSLVVDLLSTAGLADPSLGLREYDLNEDESISACTPEHIDEDLNNAGYERNRGSMTDKGITEAVKTSENVIKQYIHYYNLGKLIKKERTQNQNSNGSKSKNKQQRAPSF